MCVSTQARQCEHSKVKPCSCTCGDAWAHERSRALLWWRLDTWKEDGVKGCLLQTGWDRWSVWDNRLCWASAPLDKGQGLHSGDHPHSITERCFGVGGPQSVG